jgi:hypothetical protein
MPFLQLNRITIPAGETIFGPTQIPDPISVLEIAMDRNQWPQGENLLSISLQVSQDNVTYQEVVGESGIPGGNRKHNTAVIRRTFEPPLPAGLWARFVMTATVPLDTRIRFTWQ